MHMASRLATAVAPSRPTSCDGECLNLHWAKLLNDPSLLLMRFPVVFQEGKNSDNDRCD